MLKLFKRDKKTKYDSSLIVNSRMDSVLKNVNNEISTDDIYDFLLERIDE